MTDQELVQKDIAALYLGNLGTVEFDLRLPARGMYGSQVTWQSDNPMLIDHLGRVSRPAYGRGNRTAALTARFTYGAYTEEKTYTVTVLEKGNDIEVSEILPVLVDAVQGQPVFLPSASAVKTQDGRTIAHFLDWDNGLEQIWHQPGTYRICGKLRGTQIPVSGQVRVRKTAPVPPPLPVRSAESLGDYTSLLPGSFFCDAQERVHQYLLAADPDQWLFNFRRAAGLPTRNAPPMTGWDAPEGLLRGHSTGHFLSALALCWRAVGDEKILLKAQYMVDALLECQEAFAAQDGFHPGFLSAYSEEQFDLLEVLTPYPEIWAPYYTLHKILAGLLDLFRLANIPQALTAAEGIGGWIYARLSRLSHAQRVKMWGTYIAGEFGGINESLAELYILTNKDIYLTAARYFDNDRLFCPLEQGADALDGMHANQHIPQVIGAMRIFEAAGETRYFQIADRFWNMVVNAHIYAPGGTGESEMFHRPGNIAGLLTDSTQESCATYNLLKLTMELFQYRPDASYMDYYERAVFNHIPASCDHLPSGGTTYFLSMKPKAIKKFDCSENTCCHGTGLESQFKCTENIYFRKSDGIYVNLLIPSRLYLPSEGIDLTLRTALSDPGTAEIILKSEKPITLYVRVPYWVCGEVLVNGNPARVSDRCLEIHPDQSAIQIHFPCALRYERPPDRDDMFTVHYGPYLLAALTDCPDRLRIRLDDPEKCFTPDPAAPLAFRHIQSGILFVPFARVWKEEYQVYLQNL